MAKFADVNNTAACTGGWPTAMFVLKTQAKAAGWTVPRSSDGLTYNASGDQITTAAAGANGMGNAGSWYALRDPAGRRELCVQDHPGNGIRIKYSALARFTGGTPAATRVPSATDEQMLCGAGTDAAPSYSPFFSASGTRRYHVVAQSTPVGGVYYLELFVTVPGSASQDGGVIICEPMAPGSYDASDGDPCVWTVGGYGSSQFGWFGFGTAGQVWSAGISANVGPFGGALGVDLGSGGDVNGRPWYSASISGSVRIKGVGAFVAAKGPARTYPATMNTATDAYAYLGSWVYPYPDNIAPSVS